MCAKISAYNDNFFKKEAIGWKENRKGLDCGLQGQASSVPRGKERSVKKSKEVSFR